MRGWCWLLVLMLDFRVWVAGFGSYKVGGLPQHLQWAVTEVSRTGPWRRNFHFEWFLHLAGKYSNRYQHCETSGKRFERGVSLDAMKLFKGSLPNCPRNHHCSQWAWNKMKYCLCGAKDAVSLSLGLVSVLSWGVAEVPQIITNYKEKSTEGLSIAFLMTWIVGDFFNLFGCLLEPATLPTQYYMAMLYTVTTIVLASQTIYYTHIYHRLKANRRGHPNKIPIHQQSEIDKANSAKKVKIGGSCTDGSNIIEGGRLPSSPIAVSAPVHSRRGSHGEDMYYMSARSLSKSHTPIAGSYLAQSRGSDRTTVIPIHDQDSVEEPLLFGPVAAQSAPTVNTKRMLCAVSALTFFLSNFYLHHSVINIPNMVVEKQQKGIVIRVGRKLLQNNMALSLRYRSEGNSEIGSFLGWTMAAIYMGGRLPQIWLNIRRGNVEGLNPLMFIFALVGNVTYVASILVSSLEWSRLRPNLPWLVDAGGCVLLDTFILLQFLYFRIRKPKQPNNKEEDFTAVS